MKFLVPSLMKLSGNILKVIQAQVIALYSVSNLPYKFGTPSKLMIDIYLESKTTLQLVVMVMDQHFGLMRL